MAEERRLVTILFADVTGSTALGETLDPEDVRALMAQFFAICKEVIGLRAWRTSATLISSRASGSVRHDRDPQTAHTPNDIDSSPVRTTFRENDC